jgi:anti-anti-sigma factor
MSTFQITKEDNSCFVKVSASINMNNALELRNLIQEQVDGGSNKIVLDLADGIYMDSSGLGAVFHSQKYISDKGGEFFLKNVSKEVMTILRIANLDKYLQFMK